MTSTCGYLDKQAKNEHSPQSAKRGIFVLFENSRRGFINVYRNFVIVTPMVQTGH